jgi:hypothetical protein
VAWFNSQARLLIAGKQHRVEVSIIDDDWARSRVEVMLNDPLTPEQQADPATRPRPDAPARAEPAADQRAP